MKLKSPANSPYLVPPHTKVKLDKFSTADHDGFANESAANAVLASHRDQLAALQEVLYASQSHALLIVLQGMDTAGKDGTIRHIFSGINPQGCDVASFKTPTPLEASHDFLWRCHAHVPARGMIGVFNRSHYEDVLFPRVHGTMTPKRARQHMQDINDWEHTLANQNVLILKFFLHISHAEQTRRLQARIDDPDKRWKLSPADFAERKFWPDYCDAYQDVIRHTSTKHAPWFVIPSDHKWYRNVVISGLLVNALQGLKLKYPDPTFNPAGLDLATMTPAAAAKKAAALAVKAGAKP